MTEGWVVSVWVPVLVAFVGAVGAYAAQRVSSQRAKRYSPVDDAAKVTEMARLFAADLNTVLAAERLEHSNEEQAYRDEIAKLRGRVARLEAEVVRLGGDPAALAPG